MCLYINIIIGNPYKCFICAHDCINLKNFGEHLLFHEKATFYYPGMNGPPKLEKLKKTKTKTKKKKKSKSNKLSTVDDPPNVSTIVVDSSNVKTPKVNKNAPIIVVNALDATPKVDKNKSNVIGGYFATEPNATKKQRVIKKKKNTDRLVPNHNMWNYRRTIDIPHHILNTTNKVPNVIQIDDTTNDDSDNDLSDVQELLDSFPEPITKKTDVIADNIPDDNDSQTNNDTNEDDIRILAVKKTVVCNGTVTIDNNTDDDIQIMETKKSTYTYNPDLFVNKMNNSKENNGDTDDDSLMDLTQEVMEETKEDNQLTNQPQITNDNTKENNINSCANDNEINHVIEIETTETKEDNIDTNEEPTIPIEPNDSSPTMLTNNNHKNETSKNMENEINTNNETSISPLHDNNTNTINMDHDMNDIDIDNLDDYLDPLNIPNINNDNESDSNNNHGYGLMKTNNDMLCFY